MTRDEWIAAQLAKAPQPKQEQVDAISRVLSSARKAAS